MSLTFGEKIRIARKNKYLTQKQLADQIGAKHNSVSDWENNKNKPDPDTIELLCGVLEISPSYLLASSEDTLSPSEKALIDKYRFISEHSTSLARSIRDSIDTGYDIAVLLKDKDSYIKELESQLRPSSNSKSKTQETIDFVEQKMFDEIARKFEEQKKAKKKNDVG